MNRHYHINKIKPILITMFFLQLFVLINCIDTNADDYPDKWYGWHCPLVDLNKEQNYYSPFAFVNQNIINAWGYKAKPVEEIKDLLPEGFYNIIKDPESWGPIRVNETEYIPKEQWPGERIKLRQEATNKYAGTARLDGKGHIRDYKSGIPFPGSENPIEICWNMLKAMNWGQEMWTDFVTAIVGKKGDMRFSKTSLLNFCYKGRIFGDNIPSYNPNPNNYDFLTAYLFREPSDIRGMVNLNYRYDDPDKDDDSWMYITALRRVRRMSTAQRWDKLPGGNDISYDNATGFYGKPTNYAWRYLGRKLLLVGHNTSPELQMLKSKPAGGVNDKEYQRVNTVVIEYTPKITATISKGVLYLDPESYACYYCDNYDKKGRLWIVFNQMWAPHKDGNINPQNYLTADVQRTHTSSNYTYTLWQDTPAVTEKGVTPECMIMESLRNLGGGR
ncbi:conserved hypothetical protein [uncultured Desulfobacterium sp.]|uniref:DUF1329 domain-containing protein n=1 Tax=uncultured Desulfobacterium sp. TaxID=201089 RepID=A0A445MV69_9BACT|nr:conserved hypothetical protein [uncultured Desulfobacterium sp.]